MMCRPVMRGRLCDSCFYTKVIKRLEKKKIYVRQFTQWRLKKALKMNILRTFYSLMDITEEASLDFFVFFT